MLKDHFNTSFANSLNQNISYVGLREEFAERKRALCTAFESVGSAANYILRDDLTRFEASMAELLGVSHAIGVNSGADAIFLALKALDIGPGDEVITVAHTFVATLAAIAHCGAKPVLVDVGSDFNIDVSALELAITPKTRAILPVHMNGRCCDMPSIVAIAERYGLWIIEDAAQALGARIEGRAAGSFGAAGAFSLHPMKNLHGYGDGGMIATDDPAMAECLRTLRNHGQNADRQVVAFGFNSRLDNLQAALLNVNLLYFPGDIERRRQIAARYDVGFADCAGLQLPIPPSSGAYFDVYSAYPVLSTERDALQAHLRSLGIECFIHWEQPLHRNPHLGLPPAVLPQTERVSREVLSLPIHPYLGDTECDYVIAAVREFCDGR